MANALTANQPKSVTTLPRPALREDWLKLRRTYLGGTDVAGVMGISQYNTPMSVWADKTGRAEEKVPSLSMKAGTELEALVAREFAERTGMVVRNFNFCLVDSIYHLGGDVDRLVVPEGEAVASVRQNIRAKAVLECKTSHDFAKWDEIPAHYMTQVQTYLYLTGCEVAYLACYFAAVKGADPFEVYTIPRDEEMIEAIKQSAKAFWEAYVLTDTQPAPTKEMDTAVLYPSYTPKTSVEGGADAEEMLAELRAIKAEEKALKERKEALAVRAQSLMGTAEVLTLNGKKVATWAEKAGSVSWVSVAKALNPPPELVEKFRGEAHRSFDWARSL